MLTCELRRAAGRLPALSPHISPHHPPYLPQVVCQLAEARAHSLGGQPVNALLPALSAVALCEGRGLRGLYSSAAQLLGSV